MVSKTQKLLAAGFVLALGLALAWPFRRSEPLRPRQLAPISQSVSAAHGEGSSALVALKPVIDPLAESTAAGETLGRSVFSTAAAKTPEDPVILPTPSEPMTPAAPPSAAVSNVETAMTAASERIHVVHDGDSLERLAGRYLGDEGRALEIFDLNRDVLANPHWLPIGSELRIPIERTLTSDGSRSADAAP
jgi:nucleoid-associated protein YgaU